MDEGDRSDRDDESDRETGSADIDTGNCDPEAGKFDSADLEADDFAEDGPSDDGKDGDDESITGEGDGSIGAGDRGSSGESAGDTGSETGVGDVSEESGEGDRLDDDRSGDDRPGGDPPSDDRLGGDPPSDDRLGDDPPSDDRLGDDRSDDDRSGGDQPSDDRSGDDHSGGAPGEAGRDRTDADRSGAEASHRSEGSEKGFLYRFRNDREGVLMWIREMLSSVAIVLVIGLILFGVSGVWPPMVAVESGSMEPNMEVGDLVFVTDPGRLAPDAADNEVGVVTHEAGEAADYRTFGSYGSVVIYRPPGRTASPIIHRAMFHVEEGEDWYDRADDQYHSAAGCGELTHCPAPHDGFITLGDNNAEYDQASGLAAPVRADWVTGVARVRVPYLGYVRLIATGQAEPRDVVATSVAAAAGPSDPSGDTRGSAPVAKAVTTDAKATASGGGGTAGAAG